MLIDWVRSGRTGKYLALGQDAQTSLRSVRTSWPRDKYFPVRPSHAVNKYIIRNKNDEKLTLCIYCRANYICDISLQMKSCYIPKVPPPTRSTQVSKCILQSRRLLYSKPEIQKALLKIIAALIQLSPLLAVRSMFIFKASDQSRSEGGFYPDSKGSSHISSLRHPPTHAQLLHISIRILFNTAYMSWAIPL